jgi:predicted molibdopterin-dependent oxidoreductase YjgC
MRIENHPILKFDLGEEIRFMFQGKEVIGYEGDTIASALHALDVRVLGQSVFKHRPRGFYCAIGNCSSCLMTVDGKPNVRTCITKLKTGMVVKIQEGKGEIL